jgi:phosphoglycolate phosphatase
MQKIILQGWECMKHIDLMIFDFDGTLVNSGGDIAASINYTLHTLRIPMMEQDEIIGYIGDGVQKLIERSLGQSKHHLFDEALKIFSDYYVNHMMDTTSMCDSVIEVLEHFRRKKKLIITNKRKYFTVAMTDAFLITHYFDDIIGADSTPYKKPDPRLLIPLIEKFGVENRNTVVVGDGVNDVMLAKNSGVLSCALLNGLTPKDALASLNPDFACEGLSELITLFR